MSSTKPIYVAVVDDDEKLCQSVGRLLRAAGLQPITYSSAESFLADTKQPRFDCLVLDVQLGGMSGIDLAHRLVADGAPPPPFIFITAHDDPAARTQAETAGCAAYFQKTDSGADVLDAIRRVAASYAQETLLDHPVRPKSNSATEGQRSFSSQSTNRSEDQNN